VLLAVMLATGLVAIDSTILATAVPAVVSDLGGFTQFPWLFSVYLLAQAVSVPVYAKLADLYGRKPLMLIGVALFLAGSLLCGFAWGMTALIAFRAVQGLGAGAIQPIGMTIIGDIYSVAERAKVQGYLASVWALSSVVGPTLGGVFADYVSWRWIFFVNIPLCAYAAWLLWRNYRENVQRTRHRIDYAGAAVLTVGLTALLLALLEGGTAWAWASTPSLVSFAVAAVAVPVFVLLERRATEPVLPLWVLSRRLLLTTGLVSAGVGTVTIGLTSYVPTFLEKVADTPPLVSGLALAALTLGWPIAASNAGRLYLRVGFKPTALIGSGLAALGAIALAATAPLASVVLVAITCFVVGIGLGLVATPTMIAAQSSVGWSDRGVVTGASMFLRSIGSALGVAVFGAIANVVFSAAGSQDARTTTAASLAVFVAVVVAGLLTLLAAVFMPRVRAEAEEPAARSEERSQAPSTAAEPA
jgi:EmrB/QacA subfamily drug resistance transporter